jgi:hypothetical protein
MKAFFRKQNRETSCILWGNESPMSGVLLTIGTLSYIPVTKNREQLVGDGNRESMWLSLH